MSESSCDRSHETVISISEDFEEEAATDPSEREAALDRFLLSHWWQPSTTVTKLVLDNIYSASLKLHRIRHSLRILCSMTELTSLSLRSNQLTTDLFQGLPIADLQKLSFLDLGRNRLSRWPSNFLRYNVALETVKVDHNTLQWLPGLLLNLPHLSRVHRENSCSDQRFDLFQENWPARLVSLHEAREAEEKKPKLRSLQALSLTSYLATVEQNSSKLPTFVTRFLTHEFRTCDSCLAPSFSDQRLVLFPAKLAGMTYPCIFADFCSRNCAASLYREWDWVVKEGRYPQLSSGDFGCEYRAPRRRAVKHRCAVS